MSRTKLGNIRTSIVANRQFDYYLASVINSDSGPIKPMMIYDTKVFDALFGNIKYSKFYQSLINDNFPLLVTTTTSNDCIRATLGLSSSYYHQNSKYHDNELIPYLTGRQMIDPPDTLDPEAIRKIDNGALSFNTLLEFDDITADGYIILNLPIDTDDSPERIAFYKGENTPNRELFDYPVAYNDTDWITTIIDYVNLHSSQLHYLTRLKELNTATYLIDGGYKTLFQKFEWETNEVIKSSDYLELTGYDNDGNPIYTLNETKYKAAWKVYYENLISNFQFWVAEASDINDVTLSYDSSRDKIVIDNYQELLNALVNNRIFIYYDTLVSNPNINYIEGCKVSYVEDYNQDYITRYYISKGQNYIEFTSKIKGEVGKNIVVNIEKDNNLYNVTITLGELEEYYTCYLHGRSTDSDAIEFRDISKLSTLVDVKFNDYVVSTSPYVRIDQVDFNEYYDSSDYDSTKVDTTLELPEGTWNLNRYSKSIPLPRDLKTALDSFKDSEYHPDLLLIPELVESDNLDDYKNQLEVIQSYVQGGTGTEVYTFSQALVTLPWRYLYKVFNQNDYLIDQNNRILYFYGDFLYDNYYYPVFYPYINDIINGQLLKIPTYNLLYDPFSIKVNNVILLNESNQKIPGKIIEINGDSITVNRYNLTSNTWENDEVLISDTSQLTDSLDIKKINYLEYNNLSYFYKNLYEIPNQPSLFITQFCCSKISRAILEWGGGLKTSNESQISRTLSDIYNRLHNCMHYVDSLTYRYEVNHTKRVLDITSELRLIRMANKLYTINIELNLIS